MTLVKSGKLVSGIHGRVLFENFGQLNTLIISLNVLEAESHFDGAQQGIELLAPFRQLGSRSYETFLARQLANGSTTHTLDLVLKVRVGDTTNDGVDVLLLLLFRNAVLVDDESSRFREDVVDDATDLLVGQRVGNRLLTALVAVVGSGCVTRVDGIELAFDVRLKVIDPVNGGNIGVANRAKGALLDNPFVELLDTDIETIVGRLVGDDTVNGGVGKLGTLAESLDTRVISVLLDVAVQSVGGTNSVLTSNHGHGLGLSTSINTLGDDGGDELEHVGANGTGDDVCSRDLLDDITLVGLGVDGTVVGDGLGVLTLLTNLRDLVGGRVLKRVDDIVHDINDDNLITSIVEESSHEATADVTTTKLDGLLSHDVLCYERTVETRGVGKVVRKTMGRRLAM